MDVLKLSCHDKWISFDPESGVLTSPMFSVTFEKLIGAGCRTPWEIRSAKVETVSAEVRDGRLILTGGNALFEYQVIFFFDGEGFLQGRAVYQTLQSVSDFCGTLCFPVPDDACFVMPMSLYNDNPTADKDHVVPHFPAEGAASLVLEETRFPIPGVSTEFAGKFFSVFVYPGKGCALGAERRAPGETSCVITTGCVAFNGRHDEAYEFKGQSVHSPKGYRSLEKGDCFEIEFVLNWGPTPSPGEGFRDLVKSGWKLFEPQSEFVLPLEEIISRKAEDLGRFWHSCGYSCVHDINLYDRKPYFLFGWAGQFCRLALCDIRYGFYYDQPERIRRGIAAVDFFVSHGQSRIPGLFYTVYRPGKKSWAKCEMEGDPGFPARALGESFSDIARIIQFCREHQIRIPDTFETAVRAGLEFICQHRLPEGVTPILYQEDGSPCSSKVTSAGTGGIPAFFTMYQLTGEDLFLERGIELLEAYWKLGGNHYKTPFSYATLDAGCEDKEAAIPFFAAAALAWSLTGSEKIRHMAESSADWLLTWVYFWNTPFREGSICREMDFHSCGWPSVSVENQHLDVFFPAWEMFLFGLQSKNSLYRDAGTLVFKAWSQGISAGNGDWLMPYRGMQAEQFFQTDWRFRLTESYPHFPVWFKEQLGKFGYSQETIDEKNLAGGCNPWQISWITALVLDAALSFKEYEL